MLSAEKSRKAGVVPASSELRYQAGFGNDLLKALGRG